MTIFVAFDSDADTARAVADALQRLGHTARELGGAELVRSLLDSPPEVVFNLAQGVGVGRSHGAQIPALCEMLGIICTGPDAVGAAFCNDRDTARRLAQDAGVAVPRGMVLGAPRGEYDGDFAEFPPLLDEAGFVLPIRVSPAFGGPGESVVATPEEFGPAVVALWRESRQPVLAEESIGGDEVTVGVVGDDPPGVFGILCASQLSRSAAKDVEESALAAADALGLRDAVVMRFRLRDGVPHFLHAEAAAGLHPETGELAILAKTRGGSYDELIRQILAGAIRRAGLPAN